MMMGNSWIYTTLYEYRDNAAGYLRTITPEFKDDAADHLRKAADLYERMAQKVLSDDGKRVLEIAPTPWFLKPGEKWTAATRKEERRRLEEAYPLERQAVAEIEQALATQEVKV
jgi:hypothetical protein